MRTQINLGLSVLNLGYFFIMNYYEPENNLKYVNLAVGLFCYLSYRISKRLDEEEKGEK